MLGSQGTWLAPSWSPSQIILPLKRFSHSTSPQTQDNLLMKRLGVLWMPKPKHHSVLFSLWTLSYPVVCGWCVNLQKKVSITWLRPKHKSEDGE